MIGVPGGRETGKYMMVTSCGDVKLSHTAGARLDL